MKRTPARARPPPIPTGVPSAFETRQPFVAGVMTTFENWLGEIVP